MWEYYYKRLDTGEQGIMWGRNEHEAAASEGMSLDEYELTIRPVWVGSPAFEWMF